MKQPSHTRSLRIATRAASVCSTQGNRRLLRRRTRLRHSLTSLVLRPLSFTPGLRARLPSTSPLACDKLFEVHICTSSFAPINVIPLNARGDPAGFAPRPSSLRVNGSRPRSRPSSRRTSQADRLAARTLLSPCPHPTARDSRHSSLTLLPAVAVAERTVYCSAPAQDLYP